jgi:hypothetical protein
MGIDTGLAVSSSAVLGGMFGFGICVGFVLLLLIVY